VKLFADFSIKTKTYIIIDREFLLLILILWSLDFHFPTIQKLIFPKYIIIFNQL